MRWSALLASVAVSAGLLLLALSRLEVETDILAALPNRDPVIAQARHVMARHPLLDRVVFDLALEGSPVDDEALARAGNRLKQTLERSGLFERVGLDDAALHFPRLLTHVAGSLPLLFTEADLHGPVAERLDPARIQRALQEAMAQLGGLEGIGQGELIARDPLRLREIVLGRLEHLIPSRGARLQGGHIVSADGRHLLLTADPIASSTEGRFAHRLAQGIARALASVESQPGEPRLRTAVVGSYRAALDNETIARNDGTRVVLISTAATIVLLLLCFRRPGLGLFSLLPAVIGTILGLAAYSLLRRSITVLAFGFGGAIISMTVDYGIAYLLLLDRKQRTRGREAARQVWSVELLAMATTVGAFLALLLSGFPVLEEIGLFAALGVAGSFLFVHTVFPLIFPSMPGASRGRILPVDGITTWAALAGKRAGPVLFLLVAVVLAGVGRPTFRAEMSGMNTVRPETLAAEEQVRRTWGDLRDRAYLYLEARDLRGLQQEADQLAAFLEREASGGAIVSGFSPSLLFPGEQRAARNLAAWRRFFGADRIARIRRELEASARALGFAPRAFEPFLRCLEQPVAGAPAIPREITPLLGIQRDRSGTAYVGLYPVRAGPGYRAAAFHLRATALPSVKVLDLKLFADRLSELVTSAFVRMLLICGIGVVATVLLAFLEISLSLVVLAPVAFSLVCSLGTLKLLGRPLDIPSLLIAIVALGMGIDYPLFLVRSHQLFLDQRHPTVVGIRSAVVLAAGSTLGGFGGLILAEHALLRSAGLACSLAIGFALLGTFLIVPPLIGWVFDPRRVPRPPAPAPVAGSRAHRRQVMRRYRHLDPYAREFARFKMLFDPMFPRLAELVGEPGVVLDVGCGYGVPATWLAVLRPGMQIFATDIDEERVCVARRALGRQGTARVSPATDLSGAPERADRALLLDVIQYLDDDALGLTLRGLRGRLGPEGRLVGRAIMARESLRPRERGLEELRIRLRGMTMRYRTVEGLELQLEQAGFSLESVERCPGREETWFVARVSGTP